MHRTLRLLVFALVGIMLSIFLWNRRYIPNSEFTELHITSASPWLSPTTSAEPPLHLPLPQFKGAGMLHLTFQLEAKELQRGEEKWQDGRMHFEFFKQGVLQDRYYLGSIYEDQVGDEFSAIVRIPKEVDTYLHLENLGLSGKFRLLHFHAVPVYSSSTVSAVLALLAIYWLFWAAAVAGSWRKFRPWLAALIWLLFAYNSVLPGPWHITKPLLGEFSFQTKPYQRNQPADVVSAQKPAYKVATSYPEIREVPHPLLRWKIRLQVLRPLLHSAFFFVPTAILLILIPTLPAFVLAFLLSFLVEFTEWAFGYSFDLGDVFDLIMNGLGIILAYYFVCLLKKRFFKPPAQ